MNRFILLAFACAAALSAQDKNPPPDKITVPLSNPSQPATVNVGLVFGSIVVTAGTASGVVVESTGRLRGVKADNDVPPGMHRIETRDSSFVDVVEDHNVVTIGAGQARTGTDITLQVPPNCSLQLKTIAGHIDVTGVTGDIEIDDTNGGVSLKNVSGSVIVHSLNGAITAVIDKVAPDKPMAFTSLNAKIEVTLPADTKARFRIKNQNGAVYTDFDMKMEADATKPVMEDGRGQGGRYRIRMDRGTYGSVNGGGPEYRFETMNGSILIHKK